MDDRTLTALKASIEKWERNAVAEKPADFLTSVSECPLCAIFFDRDCYGCPVRERTGFDRCDCTPYGDANLARDDWSDDQKNNDLRAAAQAAARLEVDFLKSLLPESEAKAEGRS